MKPCTHPYWRDQGVGLLLPHYAGRAVILPYLHDYELVPAAEMGADAWVAAIVRNPFGRLLAAYSWASHTGDWSGLGPAFALYKPVTFSQFVKMATAHLPQRLTSLTDCLMRDHQTPDHIAFIEQLPGSWTTLAGKMRERGVNVPMRVPEILNAWSYPAAYTPDLVPLVEHAYGTDLETFGYSFGGGLNGQSERGTSGSVEQVTRLAG